MSDAAPAVSSPEKPKRKYRVTGERLGIKADVAQAMREQGFSYRTIQKATGISQSAIAVLTSPDIAQREHAEEIKKGLRNQFAFLANRSLKSITDADFEKASLKEKVYAAAKATEMAGLAPPSVTENYSRSLSEFFVSAPQPVVSATATPGTQNVTSEKDSSLNT